MIRFESFKMATALLGALLLLLFGCAGNRPAPPPTEAPLDRGEYVIGAGDMLKIVVWKNPDISGEVPVRVDGMISVPLVDDVQAQGLTPNQLKAAIAEKLEDYIAGADVTVIVLQPISKRVFVIGEVARPGPVPLLQDLRVTDAIAFAGGFGQFADKGDIKIIRRDGHDEHEYAFDYDAYSHGNAPGTNVLLQAGDTVIVAD